MLGPHEAHVEAGRPAAWAANVLRALVGCEDGTAPPSVTRAAERIRTGPAWLTQKGGGRNYPPPCRFPSAPIGSAFLVSRC